VAILFAKGGVDMQIKAIRVANFRSIENITIEPTEFNVFVGQNNHGKTNLFEAVQWLYEGPKAKQAQADLMFMRNTEQEMFVEVEFVGAQDGAAKMKNDANKTKIQQILGGEDRVRIRRSTKGDAKKRTIEIAGKIVEKPPTGFDAALNDFLPKFEYIDTKTSVDDVAKYSKGTPVAIMLSGVLTTILDKSPQYQEFQSKFAELFGSEKSEVRVELENLSGQVQFYLCQQFPDCSKVRFEIAQPVFDDLLKSFSTTIDDGIETSADDKGDGMQRGLMLSILQAYSDFRKQNDDVGKTFLFFIDEAELHLHPTAQRKLKKVLSDLAEKGDQVFINTHSSVLVVDHQEMQSVFKVEKIEKRTDIEPVAASGKVSVVYDLLGGTPGDLLLPCNFIVVEGKSERTLLSALFDRFYQDRKSVQPVMANGDVVQAARSINAIEKVFQPLEQSLYGSKTVVLMDYQNNRNALAEFKTQHPQLHQDGRLFELPVGSLEEYYPAPWGKTAAEAAAMDGQKKVKLAKRVGREITQTQFEEGMPVVFEAMNKAWSSAF
jgi:putative ATP-dependent endonuclease of the OLD family